MIKKLVSLALALLMVLSLAACAPTAAPEATEAPAAESPAASDDGGETPAEPAAEGETTYDTNITISMNVLDAEKTGGTERDAWFNEKFNVTWDFIPVTWGDWTEKVRAWVAADDMPDILWWDMKITTPRSSRPGPRPAPSARFRRTCPSGRTLRPCARSSPATT